MARARRRKPLVRVRPTSARPANVAAYYQTMMLYMRPLFARVRALVDEIGERGQIADGRAPGGRALVVRDALSGDMIASVIDSLFALASYLFDSAPRIAGRVVKTVNEAQRRDMISAFRKGVGIDLTKLDATAHVTGRSIDGPGVQTTLQQAVANNVDLIKTIPQKYIEGVRLVLQKTLVGEFELHSLRRALANIEGVTERRARFIARDQTHKLVSALAQSRQQSIGVEEYIWRTSGDTNVRPSHAEKDGKTFRWDTPPDDTGHPGEDYGCRCTAEPKLDDLLTALEKE